MIEKRQMVQIPAEQIKKLLEIDEIRKDLRDYPLSKKVHLLLQEKITEILNEKSENKQKWLEYIRELIPTHTIFILMNGALNRSKEMIGIPFTHFLVANEGDKTWWCNYKEDIYTIGNFLIEKLLNKEYRNKYFKNYDSFLEKLEKICKEEKIKDLSNLSDKQLLENYWSFIVLTEKFYGLSFDIDPIDIVLEEKLKNNLEELMIKKHKEYNPSLFSLNYSIITTPLALSLVNQEQIELYRIAELIQKNQSATDKIKRIEDRFWWSNLSWNTRNEKTERDFLKQIHEIIKENKIQNEIVRLESFIEKNKKDREQLEKDLHFNNEMKQLIEIFDKYAILHDFRKEFQMKTVFIINRYIDEIALRKNLKFQDISWLLPVEVEELVKNNKLDMEEVRRRKEANFLLLTASGLEKHSGEKAIKRRKEELSADIKNIQDFRGVMASLGKITSRAKVCFSAQEAIRKIEDGDILVTGMTTPDFVPAMKKASAIVTDESGVTCHAAIVARELKKPCLVGTKIATKVINDNDLIEVNANHGVVKILERRQ